MSIDMDENMVEGVLVLKIRSDRIDAANAPAFRLVLLDRIDRGRAQIVLDLGLVEFMDSSALGALIAAVKRMNAIGTIALADPKPAISRLLALTRMDKVFTITTSIEDAVKQLAP